MAALALIPVTAETGGPAAIPLISPPSSTESVPNEERPLTRALTVLLAAGLVVAACAPAEEEGGAAAGDGPSVAITSPADGDSVVSPFEVCMDVTGMDVIPAGTMTANSGHLHVLVDVSAEEAAQIAAGDPLVIPKDETHIHMGDGSMCVNVETTAGPHTLMAILGDGAHANLNPPVTAEINVEVTN